MKRVLGCFLFLFVFNVNATTIQVDASVKIEEVGNFEIKGKLSTSYLLSKISSVLLTIATVAANSKDKDVKLQATLNIVGEVLDVAATAAEKDKKRNFMDSEILRSLDDLAYKAVGIVDQDMKLAAQFLLELFTIIDQNNETICFIKDEESKQKIKDAIVTLQDWLKENA